jgi:LysR family transcriptional regulator, glycine cleavage system transcriptional activator
MTRSLPPLTAIKAFEAAGRLGSLTLAARELGVSQVAVSRKVRELELYLDVALFTRHHRRVEITREGKRLLAGLTRAFDDIDRTVRQVSRRGRSDVLSLQSYTTFSQRWLIPRLPMFQEAHPKIEVRLSSSLEPASFQSRDLDAAIRSGRGDWKDLGADKLTGLTLVPVCSPNLLRQTKLQGPRDLAKVTLLHSLARPNDWHAWLTAQKVEGLDPHRGLKFESSALVYEAALQGLGVAIGIEVLIQNNLLEGSLVAPFAARHVLDEGYYLIWPKDRQPSRSLRLFHAWLNKQMAAEHERDGTQYRLTNLRLGYQTQKVG